MISVEQAGALSNDTCRLVPGCQAGLGSTSHCLGETAVVGALLLPVACNGGEHNSSPTAETLFTVLPAPEKALQSLG